MKWMSRLQQARTAGKFTDQDRIDAASFNTCAAYEIFGATPTDLLPKITNDDWDLMVTYGAEFSGSVKANNISDAITAYEELQDLKARIDKRFI